MCVCVCVWPREVPLPRPATRTSRETRLAEGQDSVTPSNGSAYSQALPNVIPHVVLSRNHALGLVLPKAKEGSHMGSVGSETNPTQQNATRLGRSHDHPCFRLALAKG